jgi:glycosyltransferase involved in cell wall biosynthesis
MIVKDEAHIIRRCIDSVAPIVDYVYIHDTGSTDNTGQVIKDHLAAIGKPGEVEHVGWTDFATNRSRALRNLKAKGFFDYALMIDADEIIVFRDRKYVDNPDLIKNRLTADLYEVETRMGGRSYFRPQMTSLKKDFVYKGVIHEFVDCEQEIETRDGVTEFFNKPIQDSARNQMGDKKYEKDAELLESALKNEKDDFLKSRYTFYLAQSYGDSHKLEKAIKYYERRIAYGGWPQEIYISHLSIGRFKERLKYEAFDTLKSFAAALETLPARAEALCEYMKTCRKEKSFLLSYSLGKHAVGIKNPKDSLFGEDWVYDYGIKDELAIAAYHCEDYKLSYQLNKEILKFPALPAHYRTRVTDNMGFAEAKYKKQ